MKAEDILANTWRIYSVGNKIIAEEEFSKKLLWFKDKEEYIKWLIDWKQNIARITLEQKALKRAIRQPHTDETKFVQSKIYVNKIYIRIMLYARKFGKQKIKTMV